MADLKVPVDDPVCFKVIVVLAERVDELFGHLRSNTGQRSKSGVASNSCGIGYLSSGCWIKDQGSELHLQPTRVEEELQQSKDGHVEVKVVTWVTSGGVKKLATDQTGKEEGVDGESHDLERDSRVHIRLCGRLAAGFDYRNHGNGD